MLKSDIRHQLWLTKKSFQRKLGAKEDDCVVASDSELDAKIELFKYIQSEGNALYRIVDQYQERICILAQEENALGKFLKENGKNSQTTEKVMINCGRAISYCGQMRFLIRPPLLRFFNEIEVFRRRAITDTHNTIALMEKQRTEYRASLSWMKSISNILDPDSDRMLEKFRNAQNRVRHTKDRFDKFSLDCLQKIDLLAASRCNMFSHSLIAYMENLNQFYMKTIDTLKILSSTLTIDSHYDFNILKNISETENSLPELNDFIESTESNNNKNLMDEFSNNTVQSKFENQNIVAEQKNQDNHPSLVDISDITKDDKLNSENQFLLNIKCTAFDNPEDFITNSMPIDITHNENLFQFSAAAQHQNSNVDSTKSTKNQINNHQSSEAKTNSWFDLFSELDPFADPDDMTRQFGGKVADTQAA